MSSMVNILRFKALPGAALLALALATPSAAQQDDGASAGNLLAQQPTAIEAAISKWELLQKNSQLGFFDYSGFALAYPDFPRMSIIRTRAENALAIEAPARVDLLRYFDALPPLTNPARARYAVALAADQRPEAFDVARAAWRGGKMSEGVELTLGSLYSARFTPEDHAARMDALLWQGDSAAVTRHMLNLAPADKPLATARLSLITGTSPQSAGIEIPTDAGRNSGYIFNLVQF